MSQVGMMDYPAQKITLREEGLKTAVVAHEIFHTLGRYHEHQRQDRDMYVKIKNLILPSGKSYPCCCRLCSYNKIRCMRKSMQLRASMCITTHGLGLACSKCLSAVTLPFLSVCLSVSLSACLPVCLPACLSVCLYLFGCLSVCFSVCLPACLSVCLSVCLSLFLFHPLSLFHTFLFKTRKIIDIVLLFLRHTCLSLSFTWPRVSACYLLSFIVNLTIVMIA